MTVVADAGMISAANQRAIEQAALSFILGARITEIPLRVAKWRKDHLVRTPRTGTCSPSPGRPVPPIVTHHTF